MIPKKIFQTHEWEYEYLPDFMKAITQTWIKMNPTWEYVYVSGKDRRLYVNKHHPELMQMYDIIPRIFQSDIWRYIVLYNNGGAYADMDSICIKSLDEMLNEKYTDQEVVCSVPNKNTDCINNANFMSTKMSNVLKECIDTLCLKSKNINDKIKKTVGPAALNTIYTREWQRSMSPYIFHNAVMNYKENALFEIDNVCLHGKNLKTEEDALNMINSFVVFP